MRPLIIAHRGASHLAPENTLTAFRLAKTLGADGFECDVQITRDRHLVVAHDYLTDLKTGVHGNIPDMTFDELRKLDFGSWKGAIFQDEKIATLQEAMELCRQMPGCTVHLELKSTMDNDPDFVPRVLEVLQQTEMVEQVILVSFNHALLRQAKQLMPELKVGALTYGAFLSMVLPPPVVWKDLGLVNSMDEPFSEENCIDLRNNLIYRTVADKVDMLRANFPGETVEQVIGHLEEQADVAAYIKTLDFPVDIVSCEYHTAYSNPELVNQLHAMGIQAAFWTVDEQILLFVTMLTVLSCERMRVERKLMSMTSPSTSPTVIQSPTAKGLSSRITMPLNRLLALSCAASEMVRPISPAPATMLPMGKPAIWAAVATPRTTTSTL